MASIDKINVGGAEYGIKTTNPGYLECSTARSTAAKVVTATDFTLDVGTIIAVRFTNTGTSNPSRGNLTLNVGGTGAKTIVDGHTNKTVVTYSSGAWFYNNLVNEFVYDGTYWVWLNRDNNTTYTGGTLTTSASKTGSGTTVTNTIASGTSMNNAIGTLLNNDAALNAALPNKASVSDINNINDHLPIYSGTKGQGLITNALLVHLEDPDNDWNKVGYVNNWQTASLPPDCYLGVREVIHINSSLVFVKITGIDTNGHFAQWGNCYNSTSSWTGWMRLGTDFVGTNSGNGAKIEVVSGKLNGNDGAWINILVNSTFGFALGTTWNSGRLYIQRLINGTWSGWGLVIN